MSHRSTAPRLVIALVVLSAGCSSSSSSGSGSSGTDGGIQGGDAGPSTFTADQLCALVTTAQLSTAVGVTMGAGVPSGVNEPSCSWQSADAQVGVTIAAADLSEVGVLPPGLQSVTGAHVDTITGVGDGASFAAGAPPGPSGTLDMKKGLRAIAITVGNNDDPSYDQTKQKANETAIATDAAANM